MRDTWYNNLPNEVQTALRCNVIFNIQDAKKVVELNLDDYDLKDISFLAAFESLELLDLSYNQISDLTPLSNLRNLRKLHLYKNNISDVTPLSNLSELTALCLNSNKISNIKPLSNLSGLTELYLHNNKIPSIKPLLSLVNLKILWLGKNYLRKSDFLSHKSREKDREIFAFNNGNVFIFGCGIIQKEEFIAQVNDKYGDMADYSPEYKERFM